MTQKELIEQNNRILKSLVDYTIVNSYFREALIDHQGKVASHLEQTGEVLPVPENLIQLYKRVGEASMNMAEAADLLDRYTEVPEIAPN